MGNLYRPNVDYTLATQVVGDNQKVAFIPSFQQVDATGVAVGGASSSFATTQAASSVSPAAATLLVAARPGRRSVTLTNITGTQDIYIVPDNRTTGVSTGFLLAGTKGASLTLATNAALYGTSPTAAQTIGVMETF